MANDDWPTKPGAMFVVTREQLHARVWAEPMQKLAAKLNISGNALAKTCKAHHVPVPPRGYWAEREAGRPVSAKPLPPVPEGVNDRIRLTVHELPPEPASFPEVKPAPAVTVDPNPAKLHPLVKAMVASLRKAEVDEHGAVRPGSGLKGIRIAPQSIDRAAALMDALVKALEARGHKVSGDEHHGTSVSAFGTRVSFTLYETIRRKAHVETADEKAEREAAVRKLMRKERIQEWEASIRLSDFRTHWDFFPSGEFSLQMEGWVSSAPRKSWKDAPGRKLEGRVGDIVVGIEQYAVCSKREDEERAIEAARRHEEARRREEARLRAEEEARRREELSAEAGASDRAGKIRRFVAQVRAAATPDTSAVEDWAEWALRVADEIDPVKIRLRKLVRPDDLDDQLE